MTPLARIETVEVRAYRIPTDAPEADGTFHWDATTLVVVHVSGGSRQGVGYTYADAATATLIGEALADIVTGSDAFDIAKGSAAMTRAVRNLGRPGIASMAISAVDNALWDLKAKLLNLPLVKLLGQAHAAIPIYGSGGFTSYDDTHLVDQLRGWIDSGIHMVKMKIGAHPHEDLRRVKTAREAIGAEAGLFVDANGAYTRKQALAFAERFVDFNVCWFEEPVSSDDLSGLHLLRDRAPAGIDISAGEYGYDLAYFRRMLAADAVDVVQADATRCGGITGFLRAAALAEAFGVPLSSHCAPALHIHVCCALANAVHAEYFHDHARIEQMLFDGTVAAHEGALRPDLSRPGLGIEFKRADAERFSL